MRVDEACTPTFARHETFHPRLTWFRKSVLAAGRDDGSFYLAEDAPLRLGVGKNMVRSIKFWGTAARLVTDTAHPENSRASCTQPTNLGAGLLGLDGLDPFMEDPATWWWIHWMLLSPTSMVPVWWILFNEMNAVEFEADLAERVCLEVLSTSSWDLPQGSSVRKDVTAFLRTYVPASTGSRGRFDDQFGCPLQDLGLVTPSPTGFRLSLGQPRNLPGEIVIAALLDFVSLSAAGASTASLARLVHTPGAPGRVFRMTEEAFVSLIAPVVEADDRLSLSAPAGALQISWRGDPSVLAHELLCEYFDTEAEDTPMVAGPVARLPNDDRLAHLGIVQQSLEVVL